MDCSVNTTPLLQDIDSEDEHITNEIPNGNDKSLFNPLECSDRYNMGYLIFYLLGIATLLPWNFYVTANDVSTINFHTVYWLEQLTEKLKTYNFQMPKLIS